VAPATKFKRYDDPMKKNFSISVKFTSWYLALLGALLLTLGLGTYFSLSKRMYATLDTTLFERAQQIVQFKDVINIVAGGTLEGEPGELLSFFYYADKQLRHVSYKGRKIQVDPVLVNQILKNGGDRYAFITGDDEEQLRLYLRRYTPSTQIGSNALALDDATDEAMLLLGHKQRVSDIDNAVLVITRPTKAIDLTLKQLAQILIIALPLTLLLMGCCGFFFLRIVLRPVQNINDTATEIGVSDLSQRIKVTTGDELGRLAATINHMIARLERAFARQKELTGDASHELRAPLAVIQAEATLALQKKRDAKSYQKSLEVIVSEAEQMSTLIGQLLFLARADSGHESANLEIMDLAPFLEDLGNSMEPLCTDKQLTLKMERGESAIIKGDSNLLRRVVLNLLRNAIQHTPAGGDITLSVIKNQERALLSITDNGIGIPKEELPHIFKRFYRVDKARSRESGNSGLGLAICQHIIDLHQGQIEVSSCLDHGTNVVVSLPLAVTTDS
jgi:heavy metal sensor kinase